MVKAEWGSPVLFGVGEDDIEWLICSSKSADENAAVGDGNAYELM